MNIYGADNTRHIFPVAHHYLSNTLFTGIDDISHRITHLSDASPSNQCTLVNGQTDVIEVTTEDSGAVGIAGTNIESVETQIYPGARHDANDFMPNGDFAVWSTGYSNPPDGWEAEANCAWSVEAVDPSIYSDGDYDQYGHMITLGPPTLTTSRSFKKTIAIAQTGAFKLSIFYMKGHDKHAQYYVYDNSHGAHIIPETRFPEPTEAPGADTTAFTHVIFDTPIGCGSITVGFHAEGAGDTIGIIGVSVMKCAQAFGPMNIASSRQFFGEQFNFFFQEYTPITGRHCIAMVVATSNASQIRIGNIRTSKIVATVQDPLIGATLAMEERTISSPLPYGGSLIVTERFNVDVISITINMAMAAAGEFMDTIYPSIRHIPVWWAISAAGWALFAKFVDPPQLIIKNGYKQQLAFQIMEAV